MAVIPDEPHEVFVQRNRADFLCNKVIKLVPDDVAADLEQHQGGDDDFIIDGEYPEAIENMPTSKANVI